MLIEGVVYKAAGLATGDSTNVLSINDGAADVSVQVYGTFGGSTVAVRGSLSGGAFGTIDDAFGTAMSYTAVSPPKPVGPGVTQMDVTVTGGTGVSVTVEVYVVKKVRP
jgi:hypothetical protein